MYKLIYINELPRKFSSSLPECYEEIINSKRVGGVNVNTYTFKKLTFASLTLFLAKFSIPFLNFYFYTLGLLRDHAHMYVFI